MHVHLNVKMAFYFYINLKMLKKSEKLTTAKWEWFDNDSWLSRNTWDSNLSYRIQCRQDTGKNECQAIGGLTRQQLYEESNTILEYINVPVLHVVTQLVWLTRNNFFY
jgi:hypothetical protein